MSHSIYVFDALGDLSSGKCTVGFPVGLGLALYISTRSNCVLPQRLSIAHVWLVLEGSCSRFAGLGGCYESVRAPYCVLCGCGRRP